MNRLFGTEKKKEPHPDLNDCITKVDLYAESVDKKVQSIDGELKKLKEQMFKMREGPAKNYVKQKALRLLQRNNMRHSQTTCDTKPSIWNRPTWQLRH